MLHCHSVLGHVHIDNWTGLDKEFPQQSLIHLSVAGFYLDFISLYQTSTRSIGAPLRVSNDFVAFLFLNTYLYSNLYSNRKTTESLEKSLFLWNLVILPFSKHLPYTNRQEPRLLMSQEKSLEKSTYFQGILSFHLFLDTFRIPKEVSRNREKWKNP